MSNNNDLTRDYQRLLLDGMRARLDEAQEDNSSIYLNIPEAHMLISVFCSKVTDCDEFLKLLADDLKHRLKEAQDDDLGSVDVTVAELHVLLKSFEEEVS